MKGFLFALAAASAAVHLAAANHLLQVALSMDGEVDGELECLVCKETVKKAQEGLVTPGARDFISPIAVDVCLANNGFGNCQGEVQCQDVCHGIIRSFVNETTSLVAALYLQPGADCVALGYCKKAAGPVEPLRFDHIAREPAAPKARASVPDSDILRVAHVSDLHVQMDYIANLTTDCGEPVCCRDPKYGLPKNNTPAARCGYWGDYSSDAPVRLTKNMFEFISTLQPDIVINTGDDASHEVWDQSQEINAQATIKVSQWAVDALKGTGPGGSTPFFATAFGNHDGFPVSQYHVNTSLDEGWLYGPTAAALQQMGVLNEAQAATWRQGGYYSAQPVPGYRILAMHPELYQTGNKWTLLAAEDEHNLANMTSFFEAELASAAANGEKVFILGHHKPSGGYRSWMPEVFLPLMEQYKDTVVAWFVGHTHKSDAQLVFLDANSTQPVPFLPVYVAPAPMPRSGVNPSFRLMELQRSTGKVLDFVDYRVDLRAQGLLGNLNKTSAPVWVPAVRATSAFGMPDASAASLYDMARRMPHNETLFRAWELAYHTGNADSARYDQGELQERVCNIIGGQAVMMQRCRAAFAA